MITWQTRRAYSAVARDLTRIDLAHQVHQGEQILRALVTDEETEVPAKHPVLRMWAGYEFALAIYIMELSNISQSSGSATDTAFSRTYYLLNELKSNEEGLSFESPPWRNDVDFMRSHRSNLMRRQPYDYGKTWPKTPENMPYLWPVIKPDAEDGYVLMVSKEEKDLLASGERRLPKAIKERVFNL